MCMGNSHRHENPQHSKAKYKTSLEEGEKRGQGIKFQKWEWVIYRSMRKSGTHMGGLFLLDSSEIVGQGG